MYIGIGVEIPVRFIFNLEILHLFRRRMSGICNLDGVLNVVFHRATSTFK